MIQSNCPKFLTKFQTNLMCGFEENVQKPDFLAKNGQKWQKLAIFGQNLENENFFQKSAWNIFLDSSRCSFVQKIIKSDARFSRLCCHGRTDARTSMNPQAPAAEAERPKIVNRNSLNFYFFQYFLVLIKRTPQNTGSVRAS